MKPSKESTSNRSLDVSGAPGTPDDHVAQGQVVRWLLAGDPSIRWQVMRDLQGRPRRQWFRERARVAREGWGRHLLEQRAPDGLWGEGVYSPKWTSTTYTLLLLRRLGLAPDDPACRESCEVLLARGRAPDGGINFWQSRHAHSETCVTGLVLSLLAYFRIESDYVERIVAHLFEEQMQDGGWNCRRRAGAAHSSFHTTINVLEGLRAYVVVGGRRESDVENAEARAREFFLEHRLYRSHRTGRVSRPEFTRLSFPPRWHHDVLRTLDYFRSAESPRDARLEDPIDLLLRKRGRDGCWPLQNRHPGRAYFEMEQVGKPSRWNTLRASRVLRWWGAGTAARRAP